MAETWLSPEAYDRLKTELDGLKTTGRTEVSKEIEVARAHGDLRENAEYHAAKDRQGQMEARIRQVESLLREAKVGKPPSRATGTVVQGLVVVLDVDGDEEEYVVGSREDSHAHYEMLSAGSPIGRAVLGASKGDTVSAETPAGTLKITIKDVRVP